MAGARARKIDLSGYIQGRAQESQSIADAGRAKGAGWEGLLGGIGAGVSRAGQNVRENKVRAEARAERDEVRAEARAEREWKRQMDIAELTGVVPDSLIRGAPPKGAARVKT